MFRREGFALNSCFRSLVVLFFPSTDEIQDVEAAVKCIIDLHSCRVFRVAPTNSPDGLLDVYFLEIRCTA